MLYAFSLFPSKPDWISGSSKKYPEKSFLIGIGMAKNLDDARTLARAEISKNFQVEISQTATSAESERTTKSGNSGFNKSSDIQSAQETKTLTKIVLEGVTVPETWFDEDSKIYYALAVLEKLKTCVTMANKISDEEEKIKAQLKTADTAASAIEEVKALTSALSAWDTKSTFLAKKRIVDPTPVQYLSPGPTQTEIITRRDNALKNITFIVQQKENNKNYNIQEMIEEKITQLGFHIDKTPSENVEFKSIPIIIKINISIQPVDRGDPDWKFYNWAGTIEISEMKAGNTILATIPKDGQESGVVDNAAKNKAVSAAGQQLAQAVGEWIQDYIFGNKN